MKTLGENIVSEYPSTKCRDDSLLEIPKYKAENRNLLKRNKKHYEQLAEENEAKVRKGIAA